jgi:hypothetical protein
MEEVRQYFQIVKFVILIFSFITIFIIGIWLEKNRPVELIPCGNGFAKKIKKGPPWLAITPLIEFVVITMLFIL